MLAGPVTISRFPPARRGETVEPYPQTVTVNSEKRWRAALEELQKNYPKPDGCVNLEGFDPPTEAARLG